MGIFSKSATKEVLPWINLVSVDQLNDVIKTTFEKPILLFKHSTRCMTSTMALNSFNNEWLSGNKLCNIYFIDLLRYRDVSNAIASITGVRHESPQVIVLKGRDIIYDESHHTINARRIESILKRS